MRICAVTYLIIMRPSTPLWEFATGYHPPSVRTDRVTGGAPTLMDLHP